MLGIIDLTKFGDTSSKPAALLLYYCFIRLTIVIISALSQGCKNIEFWIVLIYLTGLSLIVSILFASVGPMLIKHLLNLFAIDLGSLIELPLTSISLTDNVFLLSLMIPLISHHFSLIFCLILSNRLI